MSAKSGMPVILITAGPLLGKAVPVTVSTVAKGGIAATKVTNGLGIPIQEVASGGLPVIYTT